MRIVLTGGGSGGHIVPLIAVARALHAAAPSADLRYIGGNGFSRDLLQQEDVRVDIIPAGKLRRYFDLANIIDLFKTAAGVAIAMWKMYWYMPDAVFSKGGFGAVPVIFAAAFYRIPVIIHESDSVPGLVNRLSGRIAKRVAISFPAAAEYFPKKKTALIGNPVRMNMVADPESLQEARKEMGLIPEQPVIVILGGSQGSTRINDFIIELLPELIRLAQIIHQVGEKNVEDVQSESEFVLNSMSVEMRRRYTVTGFFSEEQYRRAFAAADVVVSRAGSGAIFEIAAFGKPSILIPLKESASDHQRLNAIEYYDAGCCLYFEEDNLLPHLFMDQLKDLLENQEKRKAMSEACAKFSRPQAAEVIAREMVKIAK